MKKCPKCGKKYGSDYSFCEACGTELSEKKSGLPVLISCAAVAVLLIVGTAVAVVTIKKGNDSEETVHRTPVERIREDTSEKKEKTEEENALAFLGEKKEDIRLEAAEESDDENAETVDEKEEEAAEEAEKDKAVEEKSETAKYETYFVVNCKESITLRKSPSISAGEICQIPFGSAVSYVETAENGFYKIIYEGKTGYGLASYLALDRQEEVKEKEVTYMQVINCRESITLRKVPSTKADEFCQIPLGAVVEYLGTAENGFYMVSYNGYTGYALASYLGAY